MRAERLADPAPDVVRERLEEVFRRAEFQRTPTWWDRIVDRVGEWLERLLGGGAGGGASAAGWGGPVAELILWIVLVVLAVALVALIVVVVARRVRRPASDDPELLVEIEAERSVGEWARLAAEHEAAGRWKDALRCRYRELVGTLVERGVAPAVPGRTTGELRLDLSAQSPAVATAFSEATLVFELAWYADRPTGAEEYGRFRDLAAVVVAGASADVPEPVGASA